MAVLAVLCFGVTAKAMVENSYNTVSTKTMLSPNDSVITTDYYDGLGRKYMSVTNNGQQCFATLQEYDLSGRPSDAWMPAPINGADAGDIGLYKQSAVEYYDDMCFDTMPYQTTNYDNSPLNRPVSVCGPGRMWHNGQKTVKTERFTNKQTSGPLRCLKFNVTESGLSCTGYVETGKLEVTKVTDEDNHAMFSFKDIAGREVLQRRCIDETAGQYADTYFVYDHSGDLRYVLPPEASKTIQPNGAPMSDNSDVISKYSYVYQYDDRKRCVSKKLPGCEPMLLEYDEANRVVFSQDGNQRDSCRWSYYSYDIWGRVVEKGLVPETTRNVSGYSKRIDYKKVLTWEPQKVIGFRSHENLSDRIVLSRYNYDTPNYLTNIGDDYTQLYFHAVEGFDTCHHTGSSMYNGKLLVTYTAVLEPNGTIGQLLPKSYYYDTRGNIVQSRVKNHLGGYDNYYYHRSFTGKPLTIRHEHSTQDTAFVDIYSYQYDNLDRLQSTTLQHDGGTPVVLTANTYNDIGQLSRLSLLNNVRRIDYGYNVRGWVNLINCPQVFRQELLYGSSYLQSVAPSYNGNVSAIVWKDNRDVATGSYSFAYDGMDRLSSATFYGQLMGGLANFSTAYSYDGNSNITAISRYGVTERYGSYPDEYGLIDNLTLTYDGNRLKKVADSELELTYAGAMDFRDGANKNTEYTWDANGNMTCDRNKGITGIKYNLLNLPARITFSDGHANYYTYDAEGRRLSTVYKVSNTMIIPPQPLVPGSTAQPQGGGDHVIVPGDSLVTPVDPGYSGDLYTTVYRRDYCGDYIYLDSCLERVLTPAGFMKNDTLYAYVSDFQGNRRAVIDQYGVQHERSDYYPYGMLMRTPTVTAAPLPDDFQPYKYGGKELDRENGLDLYDFAARQYDSATGHFTTVDPKAESYYHLSPYLYCAANPIRHIDPTGNVITVATEYQNLFIDIMYNLFGEQSQSFFFDNNNNLIFSGTQEGMNEDQTALANGINKIINSREETEVVFESMVQINVANGEDFICKPSANGGEVTYLIDEIGGLSKNYVFIDPQTTSIDIPRVVCDKKNNSIELNVKYKTSKDDLLMHGLGHVLNKGKQQNLVIDFQNNARRILNLRQLPYYKNHYDDSY